MIGAGREVLKAEQAEQEELKGQGAGGVSECAAGQAEGEGGEGRQAKGGLGGQGGVKEKSAYVEHGPKRYRNFWPFWPGSEIGAPRWLAHSYFVHNQCLFCCLPVRVLHH